MPSLSLSFFTCTVAPIRIQEHGRPEEGGPLGDGSGVPTWAGLLPPSASGVDVCRDTSQSGWGGARAGAKDASRTQDRHRPEVAAPGSPLHSGQQDNRAHASSALPSRPNSQGAFPSQHLTWRMPRRSCWVMGEEARKQGRPYRGLGGLGTCGGTGGSPALTYDLKGRTLVLPTRERRGFRKGQQLLMEDVTWRTGRL